MKKLLVTGADGMLGRAIIDYASVNNTDQLVIYPLIHKQCDLTDFHATKAVFDYIKPDYVIHTAAVVGGIGSNMNHPGKFYNTNININNNVLEVARLSGVEKLISYMSTCVFPDSAPHPLKVEDIHSGPPHPSNAAYAYAKRMLDVQSRAYRSEYGCNFITLIPCNLYGSHDNWDLQNGHVLPSLIHKAFIAKEKGIPLEVWGTGKPLREFMYAEDMAHISLLLLDTYAGVDPLIISPDQEISIKKAVELIVEYVGVNEYIFLTDKPDGQYSKPSDNSIFRSLTPYFKFTSIENGLQKVIQFFCNGYIYKQYPLRGVKYPGFVDPWLQTR
jgi:GDP-L-fucose synthase